MMMRIRCIRNAAAACVLGIAAGALPAMAVAQQEGLAGHWQGTLVVGQNSLRLIMHVAPSSDGGYEATIDSPDQGASGIPVSGVTVTGDSIRLDVSAIGAVYAGVRADDPDRIEGEWRQGSLAVPLAMSRVDSVPEVRRPQEPRPPHPYREDAVEIDVPGAGVTLAGTLTLPPGRGPVPAVVLVSGSGPQDRDASMVGHRPFLVLADYLTRSGVAVLRTDDRGVGGSGGSTFGITLRDRARDVLAMVRFLDEHPEIDGRRIGLLGHSEGGWVTPIAAMEAPSEIAFLVLMAGPGQSPRALILTQQRALLEARGVGEDTVAAVVAFNERVFQVLDETPDPAAATARLENLAADMSGELPDAQASALLAYLAAQPNAVHAQTRQVATSVWFRDLLAFDPEPPLRALDLPVLALFGDHDLQVPVPENPELMARYLDAERREDRTVLVLPGLNHLFQPSVTGLPGEYATIETTIDPDALELIREWIEGLSGS